MSVWEKFIANVMLRRFVVLLSIVSVLYIARSIMSVILLTFIFCLLVVKLSKLVKRYVNIPEGIIVTAFYLLIVWFLFYAITKYIPKFTVQAVDFAQDVINFYSNPKNLPDDQTIQWLNQLIQKNNVIGQVKDGLQIVFRYAASIGSMGVTLFLSLILSFFYAIEPNMMSRFSKLFLKSDFSWYFEDLYYFGKKFVATFGVVIEAQFFIAIVNTIITTVVLAVMNFPQLVILAIMIFILSLIPVAGVIISFVPLSLVGYSVGGFQDVIYLIITIIVVHALEAYVLNPKFMSSKTNLPIFYTFVVLLVGEHFFGTWGLICGVPIFTFLLDIIGVKPKTIKQEIAE